MRNLNYISALLCAAALITACSNEEIMENGTSSDDLTLTATMGADTRTTVDADQDNQVTWTAGDVFYAFGAVADEGEHIYNATAKFTLKEGEGTTEAKFSGRLTGNKSDLQYAVYPFDAYKSGTITFPTVYTYPNSNAPMFGKLNSDKTSVKFDKLLSGMMRIKLNGLAQGTEGSLTLTADGVEGSATLSIDDSGNPSLGTLTNGTKGKVTLNFTKTDATDPLVLDIPVPAITYTSGITAELKIDNATVEVFKTTESFDVTLGTIKEMPPISDIEIEGTTNIKFSKLVESAEDAVKALNNGEKNITVSTMATDKEIEIPADATSAAPVTINVNKVTGEGSFTIKGAENATDLSVNINVPEGVEGKLNVTGIEHVEINGTWKEVTASTGENTFVVKAGAVIKDLIVKQGNIKIEEGGVVNKLTLNNDVTINNQLIIPAGESMEVILGTHELTLSSGYTLINAGSSLKLTGESSDSKGKVKDAGNGIDLYEDGAQFTMENVAYEATNKNGYGVFTEGKVSNTIIRIGNSTIKGKYYCVATNALEKVGTGNVITLEGSDFTADETALMVNTPATVTAKNCNFTGGWQGAFLRAGYSTFDACGFNLDVSDSYEPNTVKAGATVWGNGNKAPSAAITAGNRTDGAAYDRKASFELQNGCTFSVKVKGIDDTSTYPAIYIDAENKESQGVTFTYDDNSFESVGTGLKNQNEDKVKIVDKRPG